MALFVWLCMISMIMRQGLHKIFQFHAVFGSQFCFERMSQSTPQAVRPTFTAVMQIRAPASQFTGWVHSYPLNCADDPQHLPFWQNLAASHTSTLGYMLYAVDRFVLHLQSSPSSISEG